MSMSELISQENITRWDKEGYIHWVNIVSILQNILDKNQISVLNIVDIGSNVGGFLRTFDSRFKIENALLVEPLEELLEFSKYKCTNELPDTNLSFANVALSNDEYLLSISVPSGNNLGIGKLTTDLNNSRYVTVTTFSKIFPSACNSPFTPNLIKIDAEGSDVDVLWGMIKYLDDSGHRPLIVFEISFNDTPRSRVDEIIEIYKTAFGYRLYDETPDAISKDLFLIPPGYTLP